MAMRLIHLCASAFMLTASVFLAGFVGRSRLAFYNDRGSVSDSQRKCHLVLEARMTSRKRDRDRFLVTNPVTSIIEHKTRGTALRCARMRSLFMLPGLRHEPFHR
jgi:hypothetical protein